MSGNVTSLFRSTAAHSPSMAALARESGETAGAGPVDFCIPCNPYFPTPAMFDEMAGRLRDIITYYPSSADTITAELCGLLQLPPQCVAMGNGSTELITWIDHLLVRESLAVPVPTFGRWTDQPMETGKRVDMFPLQESSGFTLDLARYAEFIRARGTRAVVVCNPNNPDGGYQNKQALVQFMDAMADRDLVVIDESFLEFADAEAEPSVVQEAMLRPNVVVLRSLGKNFGLHGIRFGYLVANPALAGRVRSMLPKWNLNSFAEHVVFMLRDHGAEYAQSLHQVRRDRLEMSGQLAALPGLTVYPSQGNFLFVRLPVGAEGTVVRDRMLTEHRVLVRECGNKIGSSSRFLRLVVRPQPDVRRLVSGMEQVLYGAGRGAAVPEPAAGNGYSSGTAAVDRLMSETNGKGMRAVTAQSAPAAIGAGNGAGGGAGAGAGAGFPGIGAAPAAAAVASPIASPAVGTGTPLPAAVPVATAAATVGPVPMPMAAAAPPVPRPAPYESPVPVPQPAPYQGPVPVPQPAPYPQPVPAAAAVPAPAPAPVPVAAVPVAPTASPMAAYPPPTGPTPPGVPARGGLTAAQVRGTNGLESVQAAGRPGPQNWPNAAGMGQVG
ncbi:histidinol-phosphate aminotransferase family protein [Streptomyces sp. CT1-17]|uniref:pyridoxal phosphate-dependent aminotransferase n=1 Tax=Streptomyces sp. CT1-17 TaxID=2885642 RepID=UPI001D12670B|nr:histidinol-phosphate transaminase [Streptomyces sp. CT1-17]MCC2268491.1 histidinol-phosphate aminotransferase family protein [Streptomyces sp. CT1-17]